MKPLDTKLTEIIDWMQTDMPFSFTRYGNGEWDLILGLGTHTGSRSQVFSDSLREAMRDTVRANTSKIMAIQNPEYLHKCKLLYPAMRWLENEKLKIQWHKGDVLHHASRDGLLFPFVDALRQRKMVFVGPAHLKALPIKGRRIVIDDVNCWENIDSIEERVRKAGQDATVSISAGPAGKVLIHRLKDEPMQLIDVGSLWDVYCGKPSRGYHRAMRAETIKKNLHD